MSDLRFYGLWHADSKRWLGKNDEFTKLPLAARRFLFLFEAEACRVHDRVHSSQWEVKLLPA